MEIYKMVSSLWRRLKIWRRFRLGPVSLIFKFERATRITRSNKTFWRAKRSMSKALLEPPEPGKTDCLLNAPVVNVSKVKCGTAIIVGVGPGFGYALARRLVAEGFDLVMVSRNAHGLKPLVTELGAYGAHVAAYGADATDEQSVNVMFRSVVASHGIPVLAIYSIQDFGPGKSLDITLPAFESAWRHNCLGAFLVSTVVGRQMSRRGSGTILLIGSTSSIVGREGHLNLAVGKFGQRALAQVLSKELWPLGVHVAHVLIDADIAETPDTPTFPQSKPEDIAFSIIALHSQPRTAWSSELDLRPWNENFWQHC
jgi:NAD(P)-dependent dehydrogenase (short-subunit alcohol dehydrogenase family)